MPFKAKTSYMLPNDDESQMTNPFNRISDLTKLDDEVVSNV